jgi:hypothetical protein
MSSFLVKDRKGFIPESYMIISLFPGLRQFIRPILHILQKAGDALFYTVVCYSKKKYPETHTISACSA